MAGTGSIELAGVDKYYGTTHVLYNLNFTVNAGEFVSLLGPSGCGKTTILRLIAGFEQLNGGEIRMDGRRIDHLEPYKRNVNTVFQNYALFPHLSVYDNIAYGLRAHYNSSAEIKRKVTQMLDMVQLTELKDRQISRMSGGQKQRVAIARAVINEPSVLLLDEPLSALDLKLRKEMRYELRRLQKQLGITFIFVTHDQEEALVMSDRVAVMNEGRIEQAGTPEEIYGHPVSQFVAEFVGETNTFEAVVSEKHDQTRLQLTAETGTVTAQGNGFIEKEMVNLSVRPDKMKWSSKPAVGFDVLGIVSSYIFNGAFQKVQVSLTNGEEVKITRLTGEKLPAVGEAIYLYWAPEDGIVMHAYSNKIFNFFEDESGINKEIRAAQKNA